VRQAQQQPTFRRTRLEGRRGLCTDVSIGVLTGNGGSALTSALAGQFLSYQVSTWHRGRPNSELNIAEGVRPVAYQSCPTTNRAQNMVPWAIQYRGHTSQLLR